jgi:hypothetical protein
MWGEVGARSAAAHAGRCGGTSWAVCPVSGR